MSSALILKIASLTDQPAGTLVIYAHEGEAPSGAGGAIWETLGREWSAIADAASFKGRQGQLLYLMAPTPNLDRLVILGSGKPQTTIATPAGAWADRGGSLLSKIAGLNLEAASIILDGADATPRNIAELTAGLHLRHYKFDKYKTPKKGDEPEAKTLTITLHVADVAAAETAIADRDATVQGTLLARDLINEPANILGPLEFAQKASELSALGVEVEILEPEQMQALGMGSLLAVAQGSRRPARLAIMSWNGGTKGDQPLAFIGKGVVFDSGGISIKPAGSMEDMKGDMGGAAAVTGLMHTLATRKAPVNVVGVIGIVENMPDGLAMRPGDILTAMSGTTIEVVNTDAEGRLVLADALWYTQDRFKPKFMINLATLTGAIIVALGHEHGGLFSNNDELAANLLAAGLSSNEKLWRLPLAPAYDKIIESRFADIKNSGGRAAGSITAAQFLQRFVNDVPWAHLDIAGMAFGGGSNEINTSWASGYGVALLDRLVRDFYEA